ncbi:unnamed protein product [Rotaria sp. Silwood2]|nr:unnamed protein product [Rotaria sp. Silwood2]CAF2580106.1 unnamed protein product [Rotaria sp. Silwood2]CAF2988139.1 unnamed protein product [Rotaria sp. Silwood2]CAF3204870.1 unnamed protein product [Rotaria sp. Silwood2]CAF3872942.1 unnamed protein product [Rotaria sp. Silwood2]
MEIKTLWKDDAKTIGIYFSVEWYPPCRDITSTLTQCYIEAQASEHPFQLVLVSSDEDEQSFNKYCAQMPWYAVLFNAGAPFLVYLQYPDQ